MFLLFTYFLMYLLFLIINIILFFQKKICSMFFIYFKYFDQSRLLWCLGYPKSTYEKMWTRYRRIFSSLRSYTLSQQRKNARIGYSTCELVHWSQSTQRCIARAIYAPHILLIYLSFVTCLLGFNLTYIANILLGLFCLQILQQSVQSHFVHHPVILRSTQYLLYCRSFLCISHQKMKCRLQKSFLFLFNWYL